MLTIWDPYQCFLNCGESRRYKNRSSRKHTNIHETILNILADKMHTSSLEDIKMEGRQFQMQKLNPCQFLKHVLIYRKMPLLWAYIHLSLQTLGCHFTHITFTINACPFPSILLLPWATNCELGNSNSKLANNYVLNNSNQILPWGLEAIFQGWSVATAASCWEVMPYI